MSEVKRAKDDWGRVLNETYTDQNGNEYEVPCYRCRPGQSVADVERLLGGACVPPSEWANVIKEHSVIAAIIDGGLTRPVVRV